MGHTYTKKLFIYLKFKSLGYPISLYAKSGDTTDVITICGQTCWCPHHL